MSREQKPPLAKEPRFEHHRLNFIDFFSKTKHPSKNVVHWCTNVEERNKVFFFFALQKKETTQANSNEKIIKEIRKRQIKKGKIS